MEDEWLVRMEIADAVVEAGWLVQEAGSGEAAMSYLAAGRPVDLLVTDIRLMGAASGWDVADAFRQRIPDLPVVYASANPKESGRMVNGGVFLEKPVRTETLVDVCRHLLGRTPAGR